MSIFERSLKEHMELVATVRVLQDKVEAFAEKVSEAFKAGNKLLFMGNGGSAADCQHAVAELIGRFKKERKGLPAIALTTDTSILTAISNDYSFDRVFSRQIESLAVANDIVVGLSTSGNSKNIVEGCGKANEVGCYTVGLLGNEGGSIAKMVNLPIIVKSDDTPRIQECHSLILHIVCEIIESGL